MRGIATHAVNMTYGDAMKNNSNTKQHPVPYTLPVFYSKYILLNALQEVIDKIIPQSQQITLLFISLDNFKKINFGYGYKIGDQILQKIAHHLQSLIHPNDYIAQIGSQDYVLVSNELQKQQQIITFAQKILDAIKRPTTTTITTTTTASLYLTASIGISISLNYHEDNTVENLLKNAEIAMYQAKSIGGNRYQFDRYIKIIQFQNSLALEQALHTAITNEEFVIYYQPIINVANRQLIGLEALLRWITVDGELKYPETFLSDAEKFQVMDIIGKLVIDASLQQIVKLKQYYSQPLFMSINFSPSQINLEQINYLEEKINTYSLQSNLIRIEITERSLLNQTIHTQHLLQKLHNIGVQLSIDDFGMEYSSLRYLKIFAINNIKIDKLFVEGLPTNIYSTAIVSAILSMASALKIAVTAEGVTNVAQYQFLQRHQCDEAQGFYFSHSLSEIKLLEFIKNITNHTYHE